MRTAPRVSIQMRTGWVSSFHTGSSSEGGDIDVIYSCSFPPVFHSHPYARSVELSPLNAQASRAREVDVLRWCPYLVWRYLW